MPITLKNKACAEFILSADGPVLVSAKYSGDLNPTTADAQFLTGQNGSEECCVIPGSTLKGVFRSFFETNERYKMSNTEDLFGTVKNQEDGKAYKGRISFHDAYADMSGVRMIIRASTAIAAHTQSAMTGTLNNVLAVEKGDFSAGFTLVNYSDDELLKLLCALNLVNEGFIRIGGRKSRGYGKMAVSSFRLTTTGGYNPDLTEKTGYCSDDLAAAIQHYKEVCGNG